jgi:MFS family permease
MAVFPHAGRAMGMAVAMIALVVATPMATGVVSARMITDLGMSEAELGQGTSLFWLATACSALLVAPQADRIGWPRAAGIGLAATAVAQFGLGVLNHTAGSYFVWMVIAGIAYGLVTPASNLTVVQDIPPGRRGLAVGTKQAAAPLAGMFTGLTAPVLIPLLGWQSVFIAAAAMTAVGAVVSFTSSTRRMLEPGIRGGVTAGWWLMPVAVAGALATVPVAAVTVFAVLTLERAGLSLALAGIVIAAASIAALGTRIWGGILIDRSGGDGMLSAAVLVFFGTLGVFGMASDAPALVVAGTVLAFSAGWGWPGLLLVGLLRYAPNAAAKVTGRFQVGTALGAASGPAIYILSGGNEAGWLAIALVTLPAIPLIILTRRILRRPQEVT